MRTRMPVTKAFLKDQTGMLGHRPFLYCECCGAERSANAGDYFMLPDSHVFLCCCQPMRLAIARRIIRYA